MYFPTFSPAFVCKFKIMAQNVSLMLKCIPKITWSETIWRRSHIEHSTSQLINYPNKLVAQRSLQANWVLSLSPSLDLVSLSVCSVVLMDAVVWIQCALELQHSVILSRTRDAHTHREKREKWNENQLARDFKLLTCNRIQTSGYVYHARLNRHPPHIAAQEISFFKSSRDNLFW